MLINKKKIKLFYFVNKLFEKKINNILKYKDLNIIYIYNDNDNLHQVLILRKLCKKNNIKFYLSNNFKNINKLKPDGIHLHTKIKTFIFNIKNKKIDIIGTAYNQIDYHRKLHQGCTTIFLSPIFFTQKYSSNKILGIPRFNLLTLNWKKNIIALGGIKRENMKKIYLTRSIGIGGISFFDK